MINIILQSLGLELANIKLYPNGLRAVGIVREQTISQTVW